HVDLDLFGRGVADAHRTGVFVAAQPIELVLGQAPFATDAVHDLQLVGTAADGPQQPVAPGTRLGQVAAAHQGVERESGIAEPAVAVVPVAHPADTLGQRCRGRGDDA